MVARSRHRSGRRSTPKPPRGCRPPSVAGLASGVSRADTCEQGSLRVRCGEEGVTRSSVLRFGGVEGVRCAPAVSTTQKRIRCDVRVSATASEPSGEKSSADADSTSPQQANVALARVGKAFGKLGYFSFWTQLILTVIAAVILTFSVTFSSLGQRTEGALGLYITVGGLLMAFLSVFLSFGYIRLGQVLRLAAGIVTGTSKSNAPVASPPNRSRVIARLQFGLSVNMIGFLFTLVGLQATVGLLVAKTLTTVAANPFLAGASPSFNPVMALDVFLVQATTNVLLSHFIGLLFTLLLLRSCSAAAPTPKPSPA